LAHLYNILEVSAKIGGGNPIIVIFVVPALGFQVFY
jgi:hypothetical protein